MADGTHIQWAEASVNPLRARDRKTGKRGWICVREDDACRNCYASKKNENTYFGNGHEYVVASLAKVEPYLEESVLDEVVRWRRPRRIFWCSMTDLFGPWVPIEHIIACLAAMAASPQHEHIILTKRHARMSAVPTDRSTQGLVAGYGRARFDTPASLRWVPWTKRPAGVWPEGMPWPMPQVIAGCSVGDQEAANRRRGAMAALAGHGWRTWVSNEPALGPVDWSGWEFLDWMVTGGESGSMAKVRPFDLEWARASRDWCASNGVPWFCKQLGAKPVTACASHGVSCGGHDWPWNENEAQARGKEPRPKLKDRQGGNPEDWPEDLRVREFPLTCAQSPAARPRRMAE